MITLRPSDDRGHADHGWLDTRHTFSFADYYDPEQMGFRALRVINEDRVQPGKGFPMHPHRDMEIVTYVLSGALAHKDSLGNGSTIRRGEIQRMSAGTGILHSEFNPLPDEAVHFFQIWILPDGNGLTPGYEQKQISFQPGEPLLIAAKEGAVQAVSIHQDARVYALQLPRETKAVLPLSSSRFGWLQLASGSIVIESSTLSAGDGASIANVASPEIRALSDSEMLFFDLA